MPGVQATAEAHVKRLGDALRKLVWTAWIALNGARIEADRAKKQLADDSDWLPTGNDRLAQRLERQYVLLQQRCATTSGEYAKKRQEFLQAIPVVEAAIPGVDQWIRPVTNTARGEWTTQLKGELHELQAIVQCGFTPADLQRCVELLQSLKKRMGKLQDLDLSWLSEDHKRAIRKSKRPRRTRGVAAPKKVTKKPKLPPVDASKRTALDDIESDGDATRIQPEHQTRPMNQREAARLMGYGKSRNAQKRLKSAMEAVAVRFIKRTRQQFVFDVRDFPGKEPAELQ